MMPPHAAVFDRVLAPGKADSLARLDALANLMDSAVTIPGTRIRFGLDSLIGLVPGIGDVVSALISSYIIWEARQLGVPRWKVARMVGNVALDTTVGAIPFLGDVLDVFYKSNRRNIRILRDHLEQERNRDVIEGEYTVVRSGR